MAGTADNNDSEACYAVEGVLTAGQWWNIDAIEESCRAARKTQGQLSVSELSDTVRTMWCMRCCRRAV